MLNLSDADVRRLYEKAELCGLTPAELLQNFIGDLVYGTYFNGFDERASANEWFDCCHFAHCQNESLLSYLLESDKLESFVFTLMVIDSYKSLIKDTLSYDWLSAEEKQENIDIPTKELAELQEEIDNYFVNFKSCEKGPACFIPAEYSLEIEIQKIMDWKAKKDKLAF